MNVQTAREILSKHGFSCQVSESEMDYVVTFEDAIEAMLEYANLHREAALKAASEKVSLTDFAHEFLQEGASEAIDKDSILNAYPKENIK